MTHTAIAKQMGISWSTLWRLEKRNQEMQSWAADRLDERGTRMMKRVINKAQEMSLRGSTRAMMACARFEELRVNASMGVAAAGGTTLNFLVPRPETPLLLPAGGAYTIRLDEHGRPIDVPLDIDDAIPALVPEGSGKR